MHASEPATRVGVEQILADIDRSLPAVYDADRHRCRHAGRPHDHVIGTVTEGEGGVVLNTTDQFRSALERVVERTNAALAGDPIA